jgi:hypothetical protein
MTRPAEAEQLAADFVWQKAAVRDYQKQKDIFLFAENNVQKIITGKW